MVALGSAMVHDVPSKCMRTPNWLQAGPMSSGEDGLGCVSGSWEDRGDMRGSTPPPLSLPFPVLQLTSMTSFDSPGGVKRVSEP